MRKTEAQTLGILAIIAVGIIVLCTWGGGQPSLGDLDNQLADAEAAGLGDGADPRESGDSLVEPEPDPLGGSPSERFDVHEIIESWMERSHEPGPGAVGDLRNDPTENVGGTASVDPVPTVAKPKTHVVARGETLSGISKQYFDTVTKWKLILETNKDLISAPEDLRPGMKLVIPNTTAAVAPVTASAATSANTLAAGAAAAARTYTVKKGDTLYGIAMRFYSSGSQHKKLLRANRDQLQSAQDLRPGMVIDVPK
jgi:nucleoid-associated protein YgaU